MLTSPRPLPGLNSTGLDGGNHAVQFNLEGALNILDKALVQITHRPDIPTVTEPVPGGNVKVKEKRGDFITKDTWSMGNVTLDYGVGVENIQPVNDRGHRAIAHLYFC